MRANKNTWVVDTQTFCGTWEPFTIEILSTPTYVEIEYEINKAALTELSPLVVATQLLDNSHSSADQQMSFEFSRTLSHTNTFSHEHGFSVGVTVGVTAKIPFVGSTSIEVSAETSHNWSYGTENSKETTFSVSTPLTVPAGRVYEATATVKQTRMTIPYIGYVHFAETTLTKKITGTYEGVDFYYLTQSVDDITSE